MTPERIKNILRELADEIVEEDPRALTFVIAKVGLQLIMDPSADRMRIIAPVASVDQMKPAHLKVLLDANFHTALDARYATHGDRLFAAFMHPLGVLTDDEVRSAASQVTNLVLTYGTTYSSSNLVFPG